MTEDLGRIEVPTLSFTATTIIHGDDDQIVPIKASAHRSVQRVRNVTLKEYPGAPHGLAQISPYKSRRTRTSRRRLARVHQA